MAALASPRHDHGAGVSDARHLGRRTRRSRLYNHPARTRAASLVRQNSRIYLSVWLDAESTRASLKATSFRERLVRVGSLWSAALATFSPLPVEIAQVNRQVQKVLDQLQVSIRSFMPQDHSWLTGCASRFSSSTNSTSCFVCQPYRCSGILLAEVCIAFEFNHEAGAQKRTHMYARSRICVSSLKLSIDLSQFCRTTAKLHELERLAVDTKNHSTARLARTAHVGSDIYACAASEAGERQ
jgi:hypothetical protein